MELSIYQFYFFHQYNLTYNKDTKNKTTNQLYFYFSTIYYSMKMLQTLRSIIAEQSDREDLLYISPRGNSFYASSHQSIDRKGNKDFDFIRQSILDSIDSDTSTHERVAVPNDILSQVIELKYPKIIRSFADHSLSDRLKFVYRDEDNEDEEVFDYLEFIIEKSTDRVYVIPTSTYSFDGNYLRFFNKNKPQQKKVMLENYFHIKTIVL